MYNHVDPPPAWVHTQPLPLDAQPPYQPPDHDGYNPTSNHSPYITPFDCHEHEGGTTAELDHDITIRQLACKLFASSNTGMNWAKEMDNRGLQGEYYCPPTTAHHLCCPLLPPGFHHHPLLQSTDPQKPSSHPIMGGMTPHPPKVNQDAPHSTPPLPYLKTTHTTQKPSRSCDHETTHSKW